MRITLATILLIAVAPRGGAAEVARPADSFVDSIGINTHAAFTWVPSYANWDLATAAVKDIGIRYVRDIPDDAARLNAMTAATGAKVCVIVQYGWLGDFMDGDRFDAAWARTRAVNDVAFLELPNEVEQYPDWQAKIHVWTNKLSAAKVKDAVLAGAPIVSTTGWDGHAIADLGPLLDYGNIHIYPDARADTARDYWVDAYARVATGPGKPVLATEVGFSNVIAGASEARSAKLLPRVFMDYYRAGIAKTFSYDLMDDGVDPSNTGREAHFGILRADGSYKPAATAIKNLISLLADPGPAFAASALGYTVDGATADVRHVLLQKRDGTFWLALWQEVDSIDASTRADLDAAPLDVVLHLDRPAVRATRYVPNESAVGLGTALATRDVGVAVDDRVTLLSLRLAEPGDANADGAVDFTDLVALAQNYNVADGARTWWAGDFTGDGNVDFADLVRLAQNYNTGAAAGAVPASLAADFAAAQASVPEPGAVVVVGMVGVTCYRRPRRVVL